MDKYIITAERLALLRDLLVHIEHGRVKEPVYMPRNIDQGVFYKVQEGEKRISVRWEHEDFDAFRLKGLIEDVGEDKCRITERGRELAKGR